jgi:hypothetical protein
VVVRLEPMTEAQFTAYLAHAIEDDAHLKSGDCDADEAMALAKADYDDLLPEGLSTKGQHLFSIRAEGVPDPVGMAWFASRERKGKRSGA